MWPFRRRTDAAGLLGPGFTDWHCHVLPGVDDGVRTMAEALEVLEEYGRRGVAEVWLTPHIMEDIPNTTAALRERFSELQAAYSGPVRLHLASENMLDSLFEERLESGDLLPLGPGGDHLLVETSYFSAPAGFHELLGRIRARGFHPVLAHPERYVYMEDGDYRRLREEGVKFQLNLPSLTGHYGPLARKKAERLRKAGWYEFEGTDLHRITTLKGL